MTRRDATRHPGDDPNVHRAEDVRGAEIILRTPGRKLVFFGGLVALVLFVLVAGFL